MLGDVSKVNISFVNDISGYVIVLLCCNVILGLFIYRINIPTINQSGKIRILFRSFVIILSLLLYVYIYYFALYDSEIDAINGGIRFGPLITINRSFFDRRYTEVVDEDFNRIRDKFLGELQPDKTEDFRKPDIIVIMSESFWDINHIWGLTYSPNPIEEFKSIRKNAIIGEVGVNEFGGGTNRSELDFFFWCVKKWHIRYGVGRFY
ncbi:MAG: hypothetical protein K6F34_01775 [Lachnospiraceae bacterium]|nr:hypothetical protein [Lachnospiraceae bacterium]